MKKKQGNLSSLSWILSVLFLLMSTGRMDDKPLLALILLIAGLFFMPPVFDAINFSFAKDAKKRRVVKFLTFVLVIIILTIVNLIESRIVDHEVKLIKSDYNHIIMNQDSIKNIVKIQARIESLPDNYQVGFEDILSNISRYNNLFGGEKQYNLPGIQNEIDNLNPSVLDTLTTGKQVKLFEDSILNITVNRKLLEIVPQKDTFTNIVHYNYFRFGHAKMRNFVEIAKIYFDSILIEDRKYEFTQDDILYILESKSKLVDRIDRHLLYAARSYMKDSFKIQIELSEKHYQLEEYKTANTLIGRALKIKNNDVDAIRLAANIAYERKFKKTAIKYFEQLNDMKSLDKESCNKLRELTRYIAAWHSYSLCCDGSRSESTGRGTCSHHGGICRSLTEPIYRYKYNYCR